MICLKEFSHPKKDILSKLYNLSEREKEHLLKLYYYRDKRTEIRGWVKEVRAYLGSVSRQKEDNKFPSAQLIYDTVWGDDLKEFPAFHMACVESFPYDVDSRGNTLPSVIFDRKAQDFCGDYILWVSKVLSRKGVVSFPEVMEKIEELWDKYPYTRV